MRWLTHDEQTIAQSPEPPQAVGTDDVVGEDNSEIPSLLCDTSSTSPCPPLSLPPQLCHSSAFALPTRVVLLAFPQSELSCTMPPRKAASTSESASAAFAGGGVTAQAQQDAVADGIENYELPRALVTRIAKSVVRILSWSLSGVCGTAGARHDATGCAARSSPSDA